jgi:lipid kinase YegS
MRARLILNGKKAGLQPVREAVAALRRSGHELEVRVTWEKGDVERLVAEAAADGVERIIAGGGDGSVNEMANGLMQLDAASRPAIGILPLGTANDFATACRVPVDPVAALKLACEGSPRPVDLARANDRWFVNVASGGFGAAVTADTPVELKDFLGGGAYTLMGILKAVNFRPYECTIRTPDGETKGQMIVGAVCNGRQAGGGQPLAPEARIDDGLLDVVTFAPFSISDIPEVAAELAAAVAAGAMPWRGGRWVIRQAVPWVETESIGELPVNLDGEPMKAHRFRFEVRPGVVRMVLPADCPCLGGATRPRDASVLGRV